MTAEKREAFGRRLQAARIARGWSQKELAQKLKVERLAVVRWEAGLQTPTYKSRRRISQVLGAKVIGKPGDWVPVE